MKHAQAFAVMGTMAIINAVFLWTEWIEISAKHQLITGIICWVLAIVFSFREEDAKQA